MKIHFPCKDRKIIDWTVVILANFEDADFPKDDDGRVNGMDVVAVGWEAAMRRRTCQTGIPHSGRSFFKAM